MKTSNADIKQLSRYQSKAGRSMATYALYFALSDDDLKIIEETIRPTINANTKQDNDLADTIQAILTYGTHRLYEDMTGKKHTLPIDAPKA